MFLAVVVECVCVSTSIAAKPAGQQPAFLLTPGPGNCGPSFMPKSNEQDRVHRIFRLHEHGADGKIELQSDESSFGRGDTHLSAYLAEGDLVAYQTGTWFVDGVEVGDGTPATVRFALVDTIQVVWTHNCEHGVIRGLDVEVVHDNDERFVVSPSDMIEFGPEQLLARVPVQWMNEYEGKFAYDTRSSPILKM